MAAGGHAANAPETAFSLVEGQNINAFVREGSVAAHLLLRNGVEPRVLVAFPAGNSGVGLWFDKLPDAATWQLEQPPQPLTLADGRGRALHGIKAIAAIGAPRLSIRQAVLSNVRFLRDYQAVSRFPPEVAVSPAIAGNRLIWSRDRIDGAPGYHLEVEVLDGVVDGKHIEARGGRPIRLRIVAATGDDPLTGFSQNALLNDRAAADPAARQTLAFLSYREKFLAGSWRFNTYFGRDTLMSVRLLMPVLRGPAIEAGLDSVLARLNANGEVAHEEGLSEFAILDHRAHGLPGGDAPTLDYGMIDDDFMLAPVAAEYLLGHATRAEARAFLARPVKNLSPDGENETAGALLVRNLRYVLAQAKPFADTPGFAQLVALKPGRMTGNWRDSEEGLGRGRFAYDVNAALVPAALDAAQRMLEAGLLDPYLSAEDRGALNRAGVMAEIWRARAPDLFRVSLSNAEAATAVRSYAASLGVPAQAALEALGSDALVFHAISLDADGAPVPIINSDEGFALIFTSPPPAELETYVAAIMRPFPAGLMTPIGLLTANPAQATPDVEARFNPGDYHGTDVWSWQQALLAAGLERQLARADLPASTRATLGKAQEQLWRVILATREVANSELWSWAYDNGRYRIIPFGAGKKDVDESNAAQLWSTVYLAVQPPRGLSRPKENP